MNTTIVVFGLLAALLRLASAIYWALSARVEIRDNIEAFIGDLHQAAHPPRSEMAAAGIAYATDGAGSIMRALVLRIGGGGQRSRQRRKIANAEGEHGAARQGDVQRCAVVDALDDPQLDAVDHCLMSQFAHREAVAAKPSGLFREEGAHGFGPIAASGGCWCAMLPLGPNEKKPDQQDGCNQHHPKLEMNVHH
jgi:hypothetical protein